MPEVMKVEPGRPDRGDETESPPRRIRERLEDSLWAMKRMPAYEVEEAIADELTRALESSGN
jgi:hypothetical protein